MATEMAYGGKPGPTVRITIEPKGRRKPTQIEWANKINVIDIIKRRQEAVRQEAVRQAAEAMVELSL